MKRILATILAAGMLMSMTACQNGDTATTTTADTTTTTQTEEQQVTTTTTVEDEQQTTNTTEEAQATTTKKDQQQTAAKTTVATTAKPTTAAKPVATTTAKTECSHTYSAGKCTRCGAIDSSYATYKDGGKNAIIRTAADGKSTTLTIDTSEADTRLQNISSIADTAPAMEISYTKFLETDGWLFFAQTVRLKYTFRGTNYDVSSDSVYKIKVDGTGQTEITSYMETEDKGIMLSEVFGFDGNNIYYVLENDDFGVCEIYKAPISSKLTNLVTQGTKIADSPTKYATLLKCSLKDGYLYFSEEMSTYDTSISASVTTDLGNYKMKLDGTGLTKI